MSDALKSLFTEQKNDEIKQKIVEQLLSDENLERKTDLDKPLRWSCLSTFSSFIRSNDLIQSANMIDEFVGTSFRFLISKDRKSRVEYIQALNTLDEKEQKQKGVKV